jgi:hypothetical protein
MFSYVLTWCVVKFCVLSSRFLVVYWCSGHCFLSVLEWCVCLYNLWCIGMGWWGVVWEFVCINKSNMGLYISVHASFNCNPFFVRSYI